jgi:TPR repeat protein
MKHAIAAAISLSGLIGLIAIGPIAIGPAWAQDEAARLTSRALSPPLSTRALPAAPTVHKLSIGPLAAPAEDAAIAPRNSGAAEGNTEALAGRAKRADAEAHYRLGLKHLAGDGVTRDFVEAFARIRLAAEAGHPRAISLFYAIGARLTAAEHGQAFERSRTLRGAARAAQ